MSWWGSSPVEAEVQRATASSIPSGDQDLALNLEICDMVRSKQATAKDTLRALKKRLYDTNPNVQILTLHLLDLLVKNGGSHFFVEFAGKEFVDAYVAELLSLHNQGRNLEVVGLMLEYLQTWARASASKPEAKYLQDRYAELKRRKDIDFPETIEGEISSSFLESATAPEWTDSDTCMKSGQAFSFYNRKHHCRNCGGVFLQEYCANFIPLPHFGINIPVRVCDDCNAKIASKSRVRAPAAESTAQATPKSASYVRGIASNNRDMGSRFRQDLDEAISLSLKTTPQAPKPAPPSNSQADDEDGMDEDVRRAIEASLAELRSQPDSVVAQDPRSQDAQSHAPSSGASEPQAPKPAIPPKDRETIEAYISSVQMADPREAIYNTRLTDLNRRAIELQPKIISELKISTHKLGTLEDLNGKLLAVASYYDRLLEAELNPGQYMPPAAPQSHVYRQPPGDAAEPYAPSAVYPSEHDPNSNGHSSSAQVPGEPSRGLAPAQDGYENQHPEPTAGQAQVDVPQPGYRGEQLPYPTAGTEPALKHKFATTSEAQPVSLSEPEPGFEREREREREPEREAEPESEPEPEPEPALIEL